MELKTVRIKRNFPPSGLQNPTGSCFMNSTLQMLYHVPLFRWLVINYSSAQEVVDKMQKKKKGWQSAPNDCFRVPPHFPEMKLNEMGDMQMFYNILQIKIRRLFDYTAFRGCCDKLFWSKIADVATLPGVGIKQININNVSSISVSVQDADNLYDSIRVMLNRDNPVQKASDYMNERGERPIITIGTKRTRFLSLPAVLTFSLGRWKIRREQGGDGKMYTWMDKDTTHFYFPMDIDMSQFVQPLNEQERKGIIEEDYFGLGKEQNEDDKSHIISDEMMYKCVNAFDDSSSDRHISLQYTLLSIGVHVGNVGGGHYYTHIRPDASDRWFVLDDANVRQISNQEAVDSTFGGWGRDNEGCAYVIMYVRKEFVPQVMLWGE
ncbi:MAG: hypothetical protein EZS28_002919 [Streblomastix strix]|uniref:USP domain-containing protein n=1 Tax=Streblomastix strix TaxID=222440 RepID=A0A5J4X3J8_9EUKA|nr:MAG: hypothetical protein EZS28_002919 [Streblomastix strix]